MKTNIYKKDKKIIIELEPEINVGDEVMSVYCLDKKDELRHLNIHVEIIDNEEGIKVSSCGYGDCYTKHHTQTFNPEKELGSEIDPLILKNINNEDLITNRFDYFYSHAGENLKIQLNEARSKFINEKKKQLMEDIFEKLQMIKRIDDSSLTQFKQEEKV